MSLGVFYVSVLAVTSPALAVYRPGNYRSGSKKSREMRLGGVMSRGHRSRGVISPVAGGVMSRRYFLGITRPQKG